ncbi:MAG: hypothetical protein WBA57_00480 [Elainellaceae cyanobacterium]
MSQAEWIRRAQQGDPQAIAQLLHIALYSRSIRVKTHSTPTCLQILLEAHRFPPRKHLVAYLHRGMAQLQVTCFETVEIYARHPDATQFLWVDGFDVNTPAPAVAPDDMPAPPASPRDPLHSSSSPNSGTSDQGEEFGYSAGDLAQMPAAAIAQKLRSGDVIAPIDRESQPQHTALDPRRQKDLGWMLVDKLKRLNPFATGLMVILMLHSLFGSHHYTPEGFMLARDPMMMFLHNINLIFHEAGHTIFSFFGRFIMLVGGSLMQVLVPAVISGYFFVTKQRFAGAVALWWAGQSLLDVSLYIKDAQERMLPLLGGEGVMHDWHFILLDLRLLIHDDAVAALVYSLGILIYGVAIALGFYYAYQQPAHSHARHNTSSKPQP